MEVFNLTVNQMLMMFSLIIVGFFLRKKNILPENSHVTMSRLETYVFLPALNLLNMLTKCTVKSFSENWQLIFYGFILVVIAILVSYPVSKLFSKKDDYQRNIYKYALTFGNYGFMGNFLVLAIWGSDTLFKYSMFTMLISFVCNSWGLYVLIPKGENSSIFKSIKKGLLAPPTVALVLGMILGLLNVEAYVPGFVMDVLSNASSCMGPVSMLLAGVVIGSYEFKSLFTNAKVYIITFLRLILIPAIMVTVLKLLGVSEEVVLFALIVFATPLGLNTIVFPAAYGGDTKTGASMAMISHTLSVITIPLMYLLFVEIL